MLSFLGDLAAYGSFFTGLVGPWVPALDAVSTGLGYASAGLYMLSGDNEKAARQFIATSVSIVGGSIAGRTAAAGYRAASASTNAALRAGRYESKYAVPAYGWLLSTSAGASVCGWSPSGCDTDAPGLTAYVIGPNGPQGLVNLTPPALPTGIVNPGQ
jgi:hypothetical protein